MDRNLRDLVRLLLAKETYVFEKLQKIPKKFNQIMWIPILGHTVSISRCHNYRLPNLLQRRYNPFHLKCHNSLNDKKVKPRAQKVSFGINPGYSVAKDRNPRYLVKFCRSLLQLSDKT